MFINELCNHASDLRARFEEVRSSFVAKLGTEEGRASLRWTAHHQRSQYKLYEEAEKVRAAYDRVESAQRSERDRDAEAEERLHKAVLERLSSAEWIDATLAETAEEDGEEDERQWEGIDDRGSSEDEEEHDSGTGGADSEDESGEEPEGSSEDEEEDEEYFSE